MVEGTQGKTYVFADSDTPSRRVREGLMGGMPPSDDIGGGGSTLASTTGRATLGITVKVGLLSRGSLPISLQNVPSCTSLGAAIVCGRVSSLSRGARFLASRFETWGWYTAPGNVSLQLRFSSRRPSSKSLANLAVD